MITAVDTNVLLDLLIPDSPFAGQAESSLTRAQADGTLVISEIVFAELAVNFPSATRLTAFLDDVRIRLRPTEPRGLVAASEAWKAYASRRRRSLHCPRCGATSPVRCPSCGHAIASRQHILTDFLVGGHATVHADRLLTRDLGYFRRYFPDLPIVEP